MIHYDQCPSKKRETPEMDVLREKTRGPSEMEPPADRGLRMTPTR